jgi:hypothetical protein
MCPNSQTNLDSEEIRNGRKTHDSIRIAVERYCSWTVL